MMYRISFILLLMLLFPTSAFSANDFKEEYIVVFQDSVKLQSEVSSLEESGDVDRVYKNLFKGASVHLSSAEKEELENDPSVRLLVENDRFFAARSTSLWGLDRIDQRALPGDGQINRNFTGAGVDVYIVDGGLRADHQEFTGRVLSGVTAISDGRGTSDCDGHGTHVAGSAVGTNYGVAPAAKVIPVRVLGCTGEGSWDGLIAALDWIGAQHSAGKKSVVNMSLAGGKNDAVNLAVNNLSAKGVSVVVAASNESQNACLMSPASARSAITVASSTSNDARSSFSNFGSCVDIFAPGSNILSAGIASSTATDIMSGTSMASPHVAGAAALLLEGQNLSPAFVEGTLVYNATPGVIASPGGGSPNRLLYVGGNFPAAPLPANDNFSLATPLPLGETLSSSNIYASREVGEPAHVSSNSGSGASVWFRWTAPASGTLELETANSSFDTLLAVYQGSSLSSLTEKAKNDDISSETSNSGLSLDVISGETYSIVVDGYGASVGIYDLQSKFTPAPPPAPVLQSAPANRTQNTTARFLFSGASIFECSLDGAPWSPCSSPVDYNNLSFGSHSFSLRSVNEISQASVPLVYNWSISLPPAKIIRAPRSGTNRKAVFWFMGVSGASFQCKLDQSVWQACSSPKVYNRVALGRHVFRLRQLRDGVFSQAVSHTWSVRSLKRKR